MLETQKFPIISTSNMVRVIAIVIWTVALATSITAYCRPATCGIFSKPDPEDPCQCSSLLRCDGRERVRREYRDLTADQRAAYVRAVYAIEKSGVWGQISQIHADDFENIHRSGNFYPWHSGMLMFIETLMMDLEPCLPGMPYFAWGVEENIRESNIWNPSLLGGSESFEAPIPDGPFAGFTVDNISVTRNIFGSTFETSNELVIAALITNALDRPFWFTVGTSLSYLLEFQHDLFHAVVGGSMGSRLSPRDPVFYLHHAYVDKWWSQDRATILGFAAEDNPEFIVQGLSVNTSYASLGNFTIADSAEIHRCITYAEPRTTLQPVVPTEPRAPAGDIEVFNLANNQGNTLQEVRDTVAATIDAVAAAVESDAFPNVNADALISVSRLAQQFDVPSPPV